MLTGGSMGSAILEALVATPAAEAIAWARRAVRESPDYAYPHRVLVTALALDGKREAAVAALAQLLHLEPGLTIEAYRRRVPLRDSPALRQMAAGLRLLNPRAGHFLAFAQHVMTHPCVAPRLGTRRLVDALRARAH